MDVMNILVLNYSSDLLALCIPAGDRDKLDISLTSSVKDWLVDENINYKFITIWHPKSNQFEFGPFHSELTFENEQDISTFVLRWI